jgi:regulation of enolase protein 1 (concanavalin A-like superfamily)
MGDHGRRTEAKMARRTRSEEHIGALPMPLRWLSTPVRFEHGDTSIVIEAGPRTDWFVDPQGANEPVLNAPALVGQPVGDFLLCARVSAGLAATFDAGVLVLYARDASWAKLCLERSPDGRPTIVSVVTRGVSDDCNSRVVDAGHVWLRVARIGRAYAFHASTDGARWDLVRHFALEPVANAAVGFEAQSPIGDGCTATFEEIRFETRRLGDLRSGE